MLKNVLKAKIHRAKVTATDLQYEGSITIDEILLTASNILTYEQVQVLNLSNGERAETYVLPGKKSRGEIILNGAMARLAQVGDLIIILSYGLVDEEEIKQIKPIIIHVDENNNIVK